MPTATGLLTAEDCVALPTEGMRLELVRGEVQAMAPAYADHGIVAMSIGLVRPMRQGQAFSSRVTPIPCVRPISPSSRPAASRLGAANTLDGRDVLPGFTLPIGEIFA